MTVKELINKLATYNEDYRVVLDTHGGRDLAEADEILGCYEDAIYDDTDKVMEYVICLYEY